MTSRQKGHDFERLVAKKLKALGVDAHRGFQSWRDDVLGDLESKEPDVVAGPPLEQFWIECKVGKAVSVWAAMEQAVRDARDGMTPVVVAHRNQKIVDGQVVREAKTLVCFELCDVLELVREWKPSAS